MAFVKLVTSDGTSISSWAEVELLDGDTVARLADRACTKFPSWDADATQVSLYRVEWTSEDVPDVNAERNALGKESLQPTWSLARACIVPRSCILVRKITGAAAAYFSATVLNVVLMLSYALADYGRGFVLALDKTFLSAAFITLAWGYIVDSLLFLSLNEGATPWPTGWAVAADWLNVLGSACYATTSILYLGESSSVTLTAVLVIEAFAALVFAAAAITGAAAWWLDLPLPPLDDPAANSSGGKDSREFIEARVGRGGCCRGSCRGVGDELYEQHTVLAQAWWFARSPHFWAHTTNFLPAVIYVASALAVLEIQLGNATNHLNPGGFNPKPPSLLANLSRIYWYGDLMWLLNAVLFLWCWWIDTDGGAEEEEEEGEGGRDGGGSTGGSSETAAGSLKEALLSSESRGTPRSPPSGGGVLQQPSSSSALDATTRSLLVTPGSRKHASRTTPYRVLGPLHDLGGSLRSLLLGEAAAEAAPASPAAAAPPTPSAAAAVASPSQSGRPPRRPAAEGAASSPSAAAAAAAAAASPAPSGRSPAPASGGGGGTIAVGRVASGRVLRLVATAAFGVHTQHSGNASPVAVELTAMSSGSRAIRESSGVGGISKQ